MGLGALWEHWGGFGGAVGTSGLWGCSQMSWGHGGDTRVALGTPWGHQFGDMVGTLGWLWGHGGDTWMPLGALWGHQSSVCAHEWVGDTVGAPWGHQSSVAAHQWGRGHGWGPRESRCRRRLPLVPLLSPSQGPRTGGGGGRGRVAVLQRRSGRLRAPLEAAGPGRGSVRRLRCAAPPPVRPLRPPSVPPSIAVPSPLW